MALEGLLNELEKSRTDAKPIRDTERYYFTVFGKPAADSRWGLSVEGHHMSLNFVVDQGAWPRRRRPSSALTRRK